MPVGVTPSTCWWLYQPDVYIQLAQKMKRNREFPLFNMVCIDTFYENSYLLLFKTELAAYGLNEIEIQLPDEDDSNTAKELLIQQAHSMLIKGIIPKFGDIIKFDESQRFSVTEIEYMDEDKTNFRFVPVL